MITVNNTTWTDHNETLELHEYFFGHYGQDVAIPMCHVCTKTTSYIVEEAKVNHKTNGELLSIKPKKKGAAQMIRLAKLKTLIKDDKVYIPAAKCEDCAAKYEAAIEFSCGNHNPPNLDTRCMLESEKERYRHTFRLKIIDLGKNRDENKSRSAAKYRI